MLEVGSVAVTEDDDVTSNRVVRQMEDRIREFERQLMRPNLRWCSDGFEFTRLGRGHRPRRLHQPKIGRSSPWRAVVNVGISGSDIRDIMLEAVERRNGA